MPDSAAITVEVDLDLRQRFEAAAAAANAEAPQVLRELMQSYVDRSGDAADHDAWFQRSVEAGLREADDRTVTRIADSEVTADWHSEREVLARRLGGDSG